MRKYLLIALWAIISTGFLYLTNCSKPLDTNKIAETLPDTVFVSDTVTFTDTLYSDTTYIDTLYVDTLIVDTLYIDTLIVDTLYVDTTFVDTVYIIQIDSLHCARLSSHRQEIVWMLFNEPGQYLLEFQALVERMRNSQEIIINIDGEDFNWDPAENSEMSMEIELDQNALIRITTNPPHAYGHSIDICLRVSRP